MGNYEISKIRSMDNEVRFVIYSHDEHAFFAGYDFMGSVNWVYSSVPTEECELTAEDDPEQIVKDLEAADEPCEPKKNVINTDELMESLKDFLEAIGCTDVKMSKLDEKELSDLYKNAVEI